MPHATLPAARPGGLAWASIVLSVLIWAGYMVIARSAARDDLSPPEIGFLRFAPAALLLAPVWIRWGLKPLRIRWRDAAIVGGLGGFGFIALLGAGLAFAPAADAGVLTPAMLPLLVALLSFFALGERFGPLRLSGFALILLGALAIGGPEIVLGGQDGVWRGHLLLLCASLCWALYTVVFRGSGMTAGEAASVIAVWASLGFLIWLLAAGMPLLDHAWRYLIIQFLIQGVLSGFVATLTFHYAIGRLGASRTAAFAALVPGLGAVGAWLVLDEPVDARQVTGLGLASLGVFLASGVLRGSR